MTARTIARERIQDAAIRLFAESGSAQVNISELAQAAGMARGTIYNNVPDPDRLYEEIVVDMAREMHDEVVARAAEIDDPAERLSVGVRLFVRRAHLEPHWGRFIVRFALNDRNLRAIMNAPPAADIAHGVAIGRYAVTTDELPTVLGLIAGSVLSAILMVIEGERTWREAGSELATLLLKALGLSAEEARAIAWADLEPLLGAAR
ncbi:hypothetical protein KOAAANKH_00768 [Brevundimonas sp. NIBR10]|uniref:TetR/AcrR family transcriptional regulator n=1 Tax=Brevundimonas sp. NIBR10 TaxID=3015997 RepID=UPI0022F1C7D7|nr:TetR/AcrR family transcriptional regulator [Brevundimonas sp. NIBR10]WGM45903.1 hypothetical protein KOAAANKH_00768 [Brevundimonas sp. NIBR10]